MTCDVWQVAPCAETILIPTWAGTKNQLSLCDWCFHWQYWLCRSSLQRKILPLMSLFHKPHQTLTRLEFSTTPTICHCLDDPWSIKWGQVDDHEASTLESIELFTLIFWRFPASAWVWRFMIFFSSTLIRFNLFVIMCLNPSQLKNAASQIFFSSFINHCRFFVLLCSSVVPVSKVEWMVCIKLAS